MQRYKARLIAAAAVAVVAAPLAASSPAGAIPAGNGCNASGVPSAAITWYPANPGSMSALHTACSWNNQPGTAGTAATATSNAQNVYLSWNVTTLVQEIYAGANHGFVVRDPVETQSGWNQFIARQGTNPPKLDVTWG